MKPTNGSTRLISLGTLALLTTLAACGEKGNAGPGPRVLTPPEADQRWVQFSPDGKRMAFWARNGDGWDLDVSPVDRPEPVRLFSTSGQLQSPLWSPDGSLLAFMSDSLSFADIWVVPSAGGPARRLTDAPGLEIPMDWSGDSSFTYLVTGSGGSISSSEVSLRTGQSRPLVPEESLPHAAVRSPDRSRIAYTVVAKSGPTIWVADSNGNNRRQLTTEGWEFLAGNPPWSPDGRELLYVSSRTGTGDIWVVPADSGKPRQLTHDIRDDREPNWSPDGKWVLFTSDRGRQTDIWIIPAAGGTPRRVTNNVAVETDPTWRPGTSQVGFEQTINESGVWIRSLADSSERRLTPDSLQIDWFNVSPDGRQLDYVVDRGGGVTDLYVEPIAGGPARLLVSGGNNAEAYWSPDGSRIVFTSNRSGNQDVWVVDVASGKAEALTDWPTDEMAAQWSSDGSSIYFKSNRNASLNNVWQIPAAGGEPREVTHNGNVLGFITSRYSPAVMAVSLGNRAGQFTLNRIARDGSLVPVWDSTNALGAPRVNPSGDSLATEVEVPGGKPQVMLLPLAGGKGRSIMEPGVHPGAWSPDGTRILFTAQRDLGIYDLKSGTSTLLTHTPEAEVGAEWTPDGKSIVFTRSNNRQEIVTVDVAQLLKEGTKPAGQQ